MDFHSTQSSARNILQNSDYAQGLTLALNKRLPCATTTTTDFHSKNYAITGIGASGTALCASALFYNQYPSSIFPSLSLSPLTSDKTKTNINIHR